MIRTALPVDTGHEPHDIHADPVQILSYVSKVWLWSNVKWQHGARNVTRLSSSTTPLPDPAASTNLPLSSTLTGPNSTFAPGVRIASSEL